MDNTSPLARAIHQAMLQSDTYNHPVQQPEHLSTHISDLYLTGDYVYKIKKPVQFDFLDFSTLSRRRYFCAEEIRLNRRFAPQLYLRTVAIRQQPDGVFKVDGDRGEVVEYAVMMKQFERRNELDKLLDNGRLTLQHIDALGEILADFHARTERATADSVHGSPANVIKPLQDNFPVLSAYLPDDEDQQLIAAIAAWVDSTWPQTQQQAAKRQAEGFVRECHGDLHLGNIALIDGVVTPFDGIEFNPELYWIDTMSDLAFPVMDLHSRGRPELANQLLNTYLSHSGDYQGLQLLPLYRVHRALVRAKINALQTKQLTGTAARQAEQQARHYLQLAYDFTQQLNRPPRLYLTHGFSGSGKTWQSRQLAAALNALHIRSDVERKRQFQGSVALYDADTTKAVYQHLKQQADLILQAGYSVIVDATFLDQSQRQLFQRLAEKRGVGWLILHFQASRAQLEQNIRQRQAQGTDPSDADLKVLAAQIKNYQPLAADEPVCTLHFGETLPLKQIQGAD